MSTLRRTVFPLILGCASFSGCGYLGLSSPDEEGPRLEQEGGAGQGGAFGNSTGGSATGGSASGGAESPSGGAASGGQTMGTGGAPLINDGACAQGCTRSSDALLALYTFQVGEGLRIFDRSGLEPALNLSLPEGADVTWLPTGLRLNEAMLIESDEPAKKLIEPTFLSQELSVELWVTPANVEQEGPARLVAVAYDEWNANFMLGQEGTSVRGRIRTDDRGEDALPEIEGPQKLSLERQHLVYTRDELGREKLYHNSDLVYEDLVGGKIDAWDPTYFLNLGAQANTELLSRDFLGTYHLLAIYSQALDQDVIRKNYINDGGRFDEQP